MSAAGFAPEMSTCAQSSSQHLSFVLNGPPVGLALRNLSCPTPWGSRDAQLWSHSLGGAGWAATVCREQMWPRVTASGRRACSAEAAGWPWESHLVSQAQHVSGIMSVSSTLCVSMFCLHSRPASHSWALALFTDSFYKTFQMRQGREWPWWCPHVYFQLFRPAFNVRLISSAFFIFNHLMLPTRENKINGLLISRNDSSSTCFGLYFIIGVHRGNSKMMVLIFF